VESESARLTILGVCVRLDDAVVLADTLAVLEIDDVCRERVSGKRGRHTQGERREKHLDRKDARRCTHAW